MQPALGVRNHGHGRTGTTNRVTGFFKCLDQRSNLGFVGYHYFHIGANGKANVTIGELVDDVAQQVDLVGAQLALGTDTD